MVVQVCKKHEPEQFFVIISSSNAAAGCNSSFVQLNCNELIAFTETIHDGMTAALPASKQHKVFISTNEKNVLDVIQQLFGG